MTHSPTNTWTITGCLWAASQWMLGQVPVVRASRSACASSLAVCWLARSMGKRMGFTERRKLQKSIGGNWTRVRFWKWGQGNGHIATTMGGCLKNYWMCGGGLVRCGWVGGAENFAVFGSFSGAVSVQRPSEQYSALEPNTHMFRKVSVSVHRPS